MPCPCAARPLAAQKRAKRHRKKKPAANGHKIHIGKNGGRYIISGRKHNRTYL